MTKASLFTRPNRMVAALAVLFAPVVGFLATTVLAPPATAASGHQAEIVSPGEPALPREITFPPLLDKDEVAVHSRGERSNMSEAPAAAPHGANAIRETIVSVMERYRDLSYVPYIWGGNSIGSESSCKECRACVSSKPRLKVERRSRACPSCRSCGIDCSHFANRVLRDAGLNYPYLDTKGMTRDSAPELRKKFNLVDMGHDPSVALPGDLLLYPKHVVLLLEPKEGGLTGDVLHVSRAVKRKGMGGIEVVRDQDLSRFRGKLLRILRHGFIFDGKPGKSNQEKSPAPKDQAPASQRELTV